MLLSLIGVLIFSTLGVLFFLPQFYQWRAGKKLYKQVSLVPDDKATRQLAQFYKQVVGYLVPPATPLVLRTSDE